MKKIMLFSISALLAIQSSYSQCLKDVDCKGDRICNNGECVEPQASGKASPAASPAVSDDQKASSSANSIRPLSLVNIFVHPLGFVQFGPIVGVEVSPVDKLVIDAHVRYSALGIVYNAIATASDDGDKKELKLSTMGIGTQVKYLIPFRRTASRPYFGGIF
jgi:hypothetical protein